MLYNPSPLSQRVTSRPLPSILPSNKDIPFPNYASALPTPPSYFLTPGPGHPSLGQLAPWSATTHTLLPLFLQLVFSLDRLDQPHSTFIFLLYVWANDDVRGRLHQDPRLASNSWANICQLIRDACPALPIIPHNDLGPCLFFFHKHLSLRIPPPDIGQTITYRLLRLLSITVDLSLTHIDRPIPDHHNHEHINSATPLLRSGLTCLQNAQSFNDAAYQETISALTAIICAASEADDPSLHGFFLPLLSSFQLLHKYIDHTRSDLCQLRTLFADTADHTLRPPSPRPIIDLTWLD